MKLSVLIGTATATIMPKFFEMQNDHAMAATLDLDISTYRAFASFEETYDKKYSFEERQKRAQIFARNHKAIQAHNADKKQTWTMETNEHADLTFEEFRAQRLMVGQDCSATETQRHDMEMVGIPDYMDWRQKGGVSPVKNQGHCGSCWTFSTTGCLESAHAIHHGNFFNLSEQQLVDCAQDFDNHGCNGGLPSHAFEYIMSVGGLEEEYDYNYHAVEGSCEFDGTKAKATVQDTFNITQGDEDQLTLSLAYYNPVSIAFEVVDDFRFYKEGVYSSDKCGNGPTDVNHAVLAVGYGTCKKCNTPFYIVKNSWGEKWGDKGFFKIARGENMCGVATCASYPIV